MGEEPGLQVQADSASGPVTSAPPVTPPATTAAMAIPMERNTRLGPDQFNRDNSVVNHAAGTVTCPGGHTVTITATQLVCVQNLGDGLLPYRALLA